MYKSYVIKIDNYLKGIYPYIPKDGKVIIFSDHGINLGEREGENYHGNFLYNITLNTFLFMNLKKKRVSYFASTIDIMPTVLELIGIKSDRSLLSLKKHRRIYAETGGLHGHLASPREHNRFCVIDYPYKLIYTVTNKETALYNLENDFEENINLLVLSKALKKKLLERFL